MRSLIISLFILFSFAASAANFSGHWEGEGTCYYQHRVRPAVSCHYSTDIKQMPGALKITTCVVWKMSWGNGWECSHPTYQVWGDVLWLHLIRAGRISNSAIKVEYMQNNFLTSETYGLTSDDLEYRGHFETGGAEWLYHVKMKKTSL